MTENSHHQFTKSILRAYDIRGIYEDSLNDIDAYYIGRSYGTFLKSENPAAVRVCVGFDGRKSSPSLERELVRGLQECGLDVYRVGVCPTPMLYFSVKHTSSDGGIMITGSHNPPKYNGFKMMKSALPLYGDEILELGEIAQKGEFIEGKGSVEFIDVKDDYVTHLLSIYKESNLKIAWDAGNGAAGEVMQLLTSKMQGTHILLNEEIDGNFPNHHPDPSKKENMIQLINAVKANNCDLGVAFDGDGDRVGIVDENGNMISGDHLLSLLAEDILKENQGDYVIADVKTSQTVFDLISDNGGKPLMWKTGHSHIKTKMAETNAVFGGEMSGHIFFRDNNCFDDAPYAAIKIMNIISGEENGLSGKVKSFPTALSSSEVRIEVEESEKFQIVEDIKNQAIENGDDVNDIDGVRANNKNGWWLVRASNTENALIARCESKTSQGLKSLIVNLEKILSQKGIKVNFEA